LPKAFFNCSRNFSWSTVSELPGVPGLEETAGMPAGAAPVDGLPAVVVADWETADGLAVPVVADGAGGGPLTLGVAAVEEGLGEVGTPVAVLAVEGVCEGAVAVTEGTVTPVVTLDFSVGVEVPAVAAGLPGIGEEGLTTIPVPPLAGAGEGPAGGILLAGVVVPLVST